MPRPKSKRPTVHTGPASHYATSPYETIVEFSWVNDGQLYGGLFSLRGLPDQDKLVVEVYRTDPGVEVRNETALLTRIRERKPGSFSGRAAHIIQLARVRDSGITNMYEVSKVRQFAYSNGYDHLFEWLAKLTTHGPRLTTEAAIQYHQALEESAHVTFDTQGDAIERENESK